MQEQDFKILKKIVQFYIEELNSQTCNDIDQENLSFTEEELLRFKKVISINKKDEITSTYQIGRFCKKVLDI